VFLREIAKRLLKGLEPQIPDLQDRIDHIFQKQLFGIAITELTSLLSRRSVYCSKYPNSEFSVTKFDDAQGNIRYKRIPHTWRNGKCIYCGAAQSQYDRTDDLETHAYEWIHMLKPEEIWNMKFDVIISNPPYQLSDGGNGVSAKPIYQEFVEKSKKLNPSYLTMIIPSRWFNGGKGLDKFRADMLSDKHISRLVDYQNAKDCFPGVSVGGGVCYFLWEKKRTGDCEITNIINDREITLSRPLDQFPVFVRYNDSIDIIQKVRAHNERSIVEDMSSRNPFGLATSVRGISNRISTGCTLHSSKGVSYINRSDVTQGLEYVDKYKVMISRVTSEHAGEPDKSGMYKVIANMKLLGPKEVCTDSYILAHPTTNKQEAENFFNYLRTKFARFLLLQALSSINLARDTYTFVPQQDFSMEWSDSKLYAKYELTTQEIEFIETMIKPMD
jgi:site-specific DNA-methyltransferase (adenine-specific)